MKKATTATVPAVGCFMQVIREVPHGSAAPAGPHDQTTRAATARGGHRSAVVALRALLFAPGHAMAAISHLDSATRRRITRDLVIELSSEDGPARRWIFDGARRTVSTRAGHAPRAEAALRFRTAGQALRTLLSPHAIGRIFEGPVAPLQSSR